MTTFHIDGGRYDQADRVFLVAEDGTHILDHCSREIYDGSQYVYYSQSLDPANDQYPGTLSIDDSPGSVRLEGVGPVVTLSLSTNDRPFYDVLRMPGVSFDRLSENKYVGNAQCLFVDATTPYGRYELWLDGAFDYLPRRSIITQEASDLVSEGWPLDKRYSDEQITRHKELGLDIPDEPRQVKKTSKLENITIVTVNGCPFISEAEYASVMFYEDGSQCRHDLGITVSNIQVDPDFEDLGAFDLSFVPDGARVSWLSVPQVRHMWRDGRPVPYVDESLLEDVEIHIEEAVAELDRTSMEPIETTDPQPKEIREKTPGIENDPETSDKPLYSLMIAALLGLIVLAAVGLCFRAKGWL